MEVFTFLGADSEPLVDEYVLERLLWLFPFVVDLQRRLAMSLNKEINGVVNSAVVTSHSRGKTKLDNLLRKKRRRGAVSTLKERRKQKESSF